MKENKSYKKSINISRYTVISMELRLAQATETIFLERSYKEILSF